MQAAIDHTAFEPRRRPSPLRCWLARRRRLALVCLCLGASLVAGLQLRRHYPRVVLADWLATQGLALAGAAIGMPEHDGVMVLARQPGEPSDVYWLSGRLRGNGEIIEGPRALHNLTRTVGAEERGLLRSGSHVLYSVRVGDSYTALERLDMAGEPDAGAGLGVRLRRQVANFQQTGRRMGVARDRYRLSEPVAHLRVRLEGERAEVDAGLSGSAVISLQSGAVEEGRDLLSERAAPMVVAEWLPWLVDRVRSVPWIGPEPIAWLEQRVFGVRDSLTRAYKQVGETDHAAEVAEAMPLSEGAQAGRAEQLAVPDPESGWPPAALPPLLTPAAEGEGEWRAVADDPFVRSWESGPPLFYQAFLRGDAERPYNRVYLTLWDPRQLQLHIVSGVEEPVSATGETGRGTIPKDPETLSRVVAAFNGGFQAVHGEFGMMADGQVYLPPKPWAATVAVYRDGSVGMGSWPGPSRRRQAYDEARAVAEIPADMLAMRQNLTSLVEDGETNPWERWWWGAAPSQSEEQTLTQRSAMCLRADGFMLYAWGDFLSPEALASVLAGAGCVRAMHLDMNAGHTGLEFYNVVAPGEAQAAAPKPRFWQYEGPLRGHPGYRVRARKGVTAMQMPLPRYIRKDARDFFYLTVKPTLPGPAAKNSDGSAGLAFETRNLPHAGWPPALARHQDDGLRLLRLDPRRFRVAAEQAEGEALAGEPLAELVLGPASPGAHVVYLRPAALGAQLRVGPHPESGSVLLGRGQPLDTRPDARAWLGVDRHGFLVYAESGAPEVPDWAALCRRLGVDRAVALSARERLGLRVGEQLLGPDGRSSLRRRSGAEVVALVGTPGEDSRVLFADTKPRPYRFWAFLQDQRVRYFRTADPSARAPGGALAPGVEAAGAEEAP